MRKIVCSIALLIFTSVVSATPATQLVQLLGSYSTYSADFSQITMSDQQAIQQQSQGRVLLQRPGRIWWQVKTPQSELIVVNGKTLWRYDPLLKQATKQAIDPSSQVFNPAFLLASDIGSIMNKFDVVLVKLKGQSWYKLTPKSPSKSSFKHIYLNFNQGRLAQLIVINNLDERSLFRFKHVSINQSISSSVFQFKPPQGVDVDVQ